MKVAIAGYAIEGKANYDYFAAQGHDITILDERDTLDDAPKNVPTRLGLGAFKNLDDFDMVVRTASMNPAKLVSAKKVWSSTNEFLEKCPAPIIGITGTKGKGTTSSLIASILRAASRTVHLVGNIGVPPLEILSKIKQDDIVVFEMSSFQLWDVKKSPHIAVVLMIEPDHLDIHASFDEYVNAKQNIASHQTEADSTIFNSKNMYAGMIAFGSPGRKIPVQSQEAAHVKDGYFWYSDKKLCSVDTLKLPGVHNQDNACAAIAAVWEYAQDAHLIERGLAAFDGLPHRLKYVRRVKGVAYYDDSIATTVGSAIAAIAAFPQPKILILGGSSKGVVDFSELAKKSAEGEVKCALLIGEQASVIEKSFAKFDWLRTESFDSSFTMKDIVRRASELSEVGDVVILSPACASFGMFKNYADRGDQFVAAVNAL